MSTIKSLAPKIFKNKLFKQSLLGVSFNVLSVIFSIVIISVLLNYMGKTNYGIWITIFAICNWINFLDGGLGNGLRNELTKKIVSGDTFAARQVITTGYTVIGGFLLIVFGLVVIVHLFFDWETVLDDTTLNYNALAIFIFGFFLLRMALKLVSKIYFSFNRSSLSFFIPMATNFLILCALLIVSFSELENPLWTVAIVYSLIPLVVLFFMTLHLFIYLKPEYRPGLGLFKREHARVILVNGSSFFLIQMGVGVLQAIIPFFITLWFAAEITAEYQVAVKYYSFILVLLNIILQTLWDSITQIHLKKDLNALNKIVKFKIVLAGTLIGVLFIMYLASNWIFRIWLGEEIIVSNTINLAAFLFIAVVIISKVFTNFLNATNTIKLQSYLALVIVILFVPVAYFVVGVLELGIMSLILTPALFYLIQMTFAIFETRKVLKS